MSFLANNQLTVLSFARPVYVLAGSKLLGRKVWSVTLISHHLGDQRFVFEQFAHKKKALSFKGRLQYFFNMGHVYMQLYAQIGQDRVCSVQRALWLCAMKNNLDLTGTNETAFRIQTKSGGPALSWDLTRCHYTKLWAAFQTLLSGPIQGNFFLFLLLSSIAMMVDGGLSAWHRP